MGIFNTRVAPSPTGLAHLGFARTAYFNWLAARASGGKFILRIDDTDDARDNPIYVKDILGTMQWLGLNYDDCIFQSRRTYNYRCYAETLIEKGFAKQKDGAIVFDPTNVFFKATENGIYWNSQWYDELAGWIKVTDKDLEFILCGVKPLHLPMLDL
jgi:hypothetical protein